MESRNLASDGGDSIDDGRGAGFHESKDCQTKRRVRQLQAEESQMYATLPVYLIQLNKLLTFWQVMARHQRASLVRYSMPQVSDSLE